MAWAKPPLAIWRRKARKLYSARAADRLEALVEDIVAAGGEALAVQTDVTNRAEVANLVDTAVQVFGRIDVLINNAGIMPLSALESLKVDEWDRMIRREHQRCSLRHCGCHI